ncbi:MAG: thiamine phosphate synthase [Proteobacteria bacterium]|nr:thiamine phosphate synthase [Pseudomonadota bacterium]
MSTEKTVPAGLYAIIDTTYVAVDDIGEVASKILAGGCKTIQLRAKGLKAADKLRAARLLKVLAAKSGATFIVNDRVDIAMLSNADGVHVGQVDLPIKDVRELLKGVQIIGLSTHNIDEAREAQSLGADYIAVGPIYRTQTKHDAEEPKGTEVLREIVQSVNLPVVAIGGITLDNVDEVLATGARAVAMISEILLSDDITAETARIVERIEQIAKKG